jgi:peptidoglycan/xylan/chitin deacetylase (PgdA/CDA1 family)
MQPSDYGPFPYVPINRRPKWKWPNGARVALWIAPNLEFFPLTRPLAAHPLQKASEQKVPTVRMWGVRDYGNRVGVFRLMDVLSKYGIRATASLNADLCDHHPQIVEDAVKLGWEFMAHNRTNSVWLNAVPPGEERELIRYCTERVQRATGKKPAGWLSSGLTETWDTLDHLVAEDYLYVTDWVNDDQPYRMSINGKQLVYLPYSYEVNDNAQIVSRYVSIDDFELMIKRTFDVLYREGAEAARVMSICLHPFISGVPHRVGGLDSALQYICKHDDVWLATGEEIVRAYLDAVPTD